MTRPEDPNRRNGAVQESAVRRGTADVVLLGTLNANIRGVRATDWMGNLTSVLRSRSVSVFNPNLKASGVRGPEQIRQESSELVGSKIVVMNFEGQGGGTSLAELRFAMLSAVVNGQKLLVNFEEPANDKASDARLIAQADAEHMKDIFGISLDIEVSRDVFEANAVADKVKNALETQQRQSFPDTLPLPLQGTVKSPNQYDFSFSGSAQQADLASRQEILGLLRERGSVVDTHIPLWSADIAKNRRKEIDAMLGAKTQVVLVGENSTSRLAHFMASVVVSYLNGGRTIAYIPEGLMEKNDVKTILSHLHELESVYPQIAKLYSFTHEIGKIPTLLAAKN